MRPDVELRLRFSPSAGRVEVAFGGVASLLASRGATEAQIAALFSASCTSNADRAAATVALSMRLRLWWRQGWLCTTLVVDGEPLATLIPIAPGVPIQPKAVDGAARWQWSRFAYLRRDDETLVLESPRAPARVQLHGQAAVALVGALATPGSIEELARDAEVPCAAAPVLVSLLAGAGLITRVDADSQSREDSDAALRQWEFHDLLFHAHSRRGRHRDPMGATFRFLGTRPPLSAIAAGRSGDRVPLFSPDLEHPVKTDPPFTTVLESRRSMRAFGDAPITLRQLGEFLYRVARVRRIVPPGEHGSRPYETSSRPYPSGGAAYDLEVYVTVNRCADLSAGLYHYAARDHQLERLSGRTADVDALLQQAARSAGLADRPQVLLTLASRFQRVSWKYSSIAYATTLKNVGAIVQTMYLAATAMGLAPCAIGTGDSDLFARASGIDPFEEPSVGEFVLGSSYETSP